MERDFLLVSPSFASILQKFLITSAAEGVPDRHLHFPPRSERRLERVRHFHQILYSFPLLLIAVLTNKFCEHHWLLKSQPSV